MPGTTKSVDARLFNKRLAAYKQLIDQDIADYSKALRRSTSRQFGPNAGLQTEAFLDILARGGKRIRGALTMLAYEMCGGTNRAMIIEAARAIEMFHAYILIIDDFQDRSIIRRGGPAAHAMLASYHKRNELAGDSAHFGASIAFNAALGGAHAAQQIIVNLDAPAARVKQALHIINESMMITTYGQTTDIINEVVASVPESEIERVLEWKTARYTFLNPISLGMVLAGRDKTDITAVTEYALHAGKAFQITDDILGVFGSEFASGKSPMDDIREGKRTLITTYALKHTTDENKNFLVQMLGNHGLTPAEFERCKTIIVESGALEFAQQSAVTHVETAIESLDGSKRDWNKDGVMFLRGLAQSLLGRSN